MASLGVHYVKSRQECKDCQRKESGLVGIASKCLGIEVHAGATHKYYHPKCFFEGSKCRDVLDKLSDKTAEEMNGYKGLSHSDQMMIYSMFANATDDGNDDEEEEKIQQRKKRASASKRAHKEQEAADTETKANDEEEKEESPKKIRRAEKKSKKVEESDEDEVIKTRSSNRRSHRQTKERTATPSITRTPTEDVDEIEVARDEKVSKAPKAKQAPKKKEGVPVKEKHEKVTGRGKPSDKMAAVFEKIFKRKIDEQVDLELESDEE